jgi:histidinol dehydrogenase
LISYSADALAAQASTIATFARAEGLEAHARAVEVRTGEINRQDAKRAKV